MGICETWVNLLVNKGNLSGIFTTVGIYSFILGSNIDKIGHEQENA